MEYYKGHKPTSICTLVIQTKQYKLLAVLILYLPALETLTLTSTVIIGLLASVKLRSIYYYMILCSAVILCLCLCLSVI